MKNTCKKPSGILIFLINTILYFTAFSAHGHKFSKTINQDYHHPAIHIHQKLKNISSAFESGIMVQPSIPSHGNKKQTNKRAVSQVDSLKSCDTLFFSADQNCETIIVLKNTAYSSRICEDSLMRWVVFVDLNDDGILDWEFSSFLPAGNDVIHVENGRTDLIKDDNGNEIPDIHVYPTPSGREVMIKIPGAVNSTNGMLHRIYWNVYNACQETSACEQLIFVTDNRPPASYCHHIKVGLFFDPDDLGPLLPVVEIMAVEFNVGSFDNCTPQEELIYTFDGLHPQLNDTLIDGILINIHTPHYFAGKGAVAPYPAPNEEILALYYTEKLQLWHPVFRSSSRVWMVNSIVPIGASMGEIDVKTSVWDKKKNMDICWTRLSSNYGTGQVFSQLSGKILAENGIPIENIIVNLDRKALEYPKVKTILDGKYEFAQISNSSSSSDKVSICARKNDGYAHGVSTYDLVLLFKHLTGQSLLTSPYSIMAADVNNDRKINFNDFQNLRALILGISESFDNESWRFPINFQTLKTDSILFYEDKYELLVKNDRNDLDFTAVKIGDLDQSALGKLGGGNTELRNTEPLQFIIPDGIFQKGEIIRIPVFSSNYKDIAGFQFSLKLTNLELLKTDEEICHDIIPHIFEKEKGIVNIVFAEGTGYDALPQQCLFTLILQTTDDIAINKGFELVDHPLIPEAYFWSDQKKTDVSLTFESNKTKQNFYIEGFNPNPFQVGTVMSVYSETFDNYHISVFDVTGKMTDEFNVTLAPGINDVYLAGHTFRNSGMYMVHLSNGKTTHQAKLVAMP